MVDAENLCGGCHKWGTNPDITKNRVCNACGRNQAEITKCHGAAFLSKRYLTYLRWCMFPGKHPYRFTYKVS